MVVFFFETRIMTTVFNNGSQSITIPVTPVNSTANSLVLGNGAGLVVPSTDKDVLLGYNSGVAVTGDHNVFVGETTGASAITSNNCTLLGDQANVGSDPLTFATAIGSAAVVNSSSMIQLGRANSDDTTIGRSLFQLTTGAVCPCVYTRLTTFRQQHHSVMVLV